MHIVSCNVKLIACVVGAYNPYSLSLLITSVIRVNPLQTAIVSGNGLLLIFNGFFRYVFLFKPFALGFFNGTN